MMTNISYSDEAFYNPEELINKAKTILDFHSVNYDTMVGIGLSGSLVIPTLARALNKDFAIIRKSGTYSHGASVGFEGTIGDRWLFVDDFISTGATLTTVYSRINEISDYYYKPIPKFVGAYLYGRKARSRPFRSPESFPTLQLH